MTDPKHPVSSTSTTVDSGTITSVVAPADGLAGASGNRDVPVVRESWSRMPALHVRDQRVLLVIGGVFFAIMGFRWYLMARNPEPLPWRRGEAFDRLFRVDVNTATWVEWSQLEGIGPSFAHRIVADRNANGRFSSINDVARVRGIGEATLDRIRPWLTISHETGDQHATKRSLHPTFESIGNADERVGGKRP